jgi:cytochrome P450
VGVKAWVAHANQEVFGKDAHMFRPERWLESPEIVKPREAYFMTVSFLVFHSPLL